MAKRNIRIYPDEALRKKCRPVKDITKSVVTLIDDMAETMYGANGAGLAAPQVGVLKRIVVIDAGEGLVELINPVFLEKSGSQIGDEGCLSLPGKWATVERPDYAKVKALNKKGETIIVEGHDLMARALCHEIDHLDGILYIDKAIEPPEKENEN
ncbi:MAG: peptide deformylase [Clostridia bacterium]|jgi:peptide deformylase|nr:peptide deformylase [Clostridia bacterium]MCI2013836.1 peptide deformylase [Clostridia bacterium]